jgi:phosphopantothenoylcysteine decarboxylase/phosphopantothenate--cysteine ligase
MPSDKKILLGVTASISLYKTCLLVRLLQERDYQIKVVMSENASRLISPQVFEALTENPVFINEFDNSRQTGMDHISLKNWGDALLYYPATANLIGQLAGGLAPNLLSTLFIAFKGPVVIAPAMNPDMYAHPLVQHNLRKLRRIGVKLLSPESGKHACHEEGPGRLASPEHAVDFLLKQKIISD